MFNRIRRKIRELRCPIYPISVDIYREDRPVSKCVNLLNENGFRAWIFVAQGDQFGYVACEENEWERANEILKEIHGAGLGEKKLRGFERWFV